MKNIKLLKGEKITAKLYITGGDGPAAVLFPYTRIIIKTPRGTIRMVELNGDCR